MAVDMSQIRDLLLPGVRAAAGKVEGSEPDMIVDFLNDDLVVINHGKEVDRITRGDIDDGSYKSDFMPRMRRAFGFQED